MFPPEILTLFPGEFRSLAGGFGGVPPGPSSRRIWNALRAVFAFEYPRPPLRDFTIEMGRKRHNAENLRAPMKVPEVLLSRFLRSQPRRIGLGHPLGRDPSRKIDAAISRSEFRGS